MTDEEQVMVAVHAGEVVPGITRRKDLLARTGLPAARFDAAVRRLRMTGRMTFDGYVLSASARAVVERLENAVARTRAALREAEPEQIAENANCPVEPEPEPAPPQASSDPAALVRYRVGDVLPDRPDLVGLTHRQAVVFLALEALANAGAVLPGRGDLRRMVGTDVQSPELALECRGLIRVASQGRGVGTTRCITICATGAMTGWSRPNMTARRKLAECVVPDDGPVGEMPCDAIAERRAADQRAEAARLAAIRSAPPACAGAGGALSPGAAMQLAAIDRAGGALAMLRDAWPAALAMLGRISAVTCERPIPLIVRLIREEAVRHGLRVVRDGDFDMMEEKHGA